MDTENIPLTIRYTYNKLVRDKIPENIDSKPGSKSKYRILNDNEYLIELNKKGAFNDKIYLEYVDEDKRNIE